MILSFRELGFSPGHRDQLGSRRGQDHPDWHRLRQQVHPPRHREKRARICFSRKTGEDHLPTGLWQFYYDLKLLKNHALNRKTNFYILSG